MLIYGAPLALCNPVGPHHQNAFATFVFDMKCQPPIEYFSLFQVQMVVGYCSDTIVIDVRILVNVVPSKQIKMEKIFLCDVGT